MPQQILLLRHGETEWSRDGKHTSTTDVALTEAGLAEAMALRHVAARWTLALVVVSPMARARDTARLAGLDDQRVEVSGDLREWDYGEYEGRTTADIRATRPGWSVWTDGAPGGESPADVAARTDRVIARCRAADGDVCLVAHAHVLRVLAARWIGLDASDGARLRLDTGTWSVLGYEREAPVVLRWNVPAS
ncbi:MAG TPA: histidine phosphatase family protein [Acidimicrobiales bacterium]|nr:histidine phosphatase family protein [Acidimicrobiales bacterium]